MPILTDKLGPLPLWGWAGIGVGGFLVLRYRQNKAAAAVAAQNQVTGNLSPDYGPAGWPGQGALSPATLPMSAISTVNGGFSSNGGGGSDSGKGSTGAYNPGNPIARQQATAASGGFFRPL